MESGRFVSGVSVFSNNNSLINDFNESEYSKAKWANKLSAWNRFVSRASGFKDSFFAFVSSVKNACKGLFTRGVYKVDVLENSINNKANKSNSKLKDADTKHALSTNNIDINVHDTEVDVHGDTEYKDNKSAFIIFSLRLEGNKYNKVAEMLRNNEFLDTLEEFKFDKFSSVIIALMKADGGNSDLISLIVKKHNNSIYEHASGFMPIHFAVATKNIKILNVFASSLDGHIDFTVKNPTTGDTPLHHAVKYKASHEVVSWLIKNGADINAINDKGETPLHIAIRNEMHDVEVIKKLIDSGANQGIKDNDGYSAIHCLVNSAVRTLGYTKMDDIYKIINMLNYDIVNINDSCGRYGNTVLHMAARISDETLTHILCRRGAVSKPNNNGSTPLHHAVLGDNIAVVLTLIDNGANVNQANHNKQIPLSLATSKKMRACLTKINNDDSEF